MSKIFKSKSSSAANTNTNSPKPTKVHGILSNGGTGNHSEALSSTDHVEEVGKEAKESKNKDRSSWVKTIGMRTLRMRNKNKDEGSSSANRASKLFSSLDRKKGAKGNMPDEDADDDDEHVKVPTRIPITASTSTMNESTKNPEVQQSPSVLGSKGKEEGEGENNSDKHDPSRFLGDGLTFKGKLIGVLEVSGPRGDRICQEALSDLKMAVKAAGEHKQKVTVHVALDGLRIRDEKTGDCLYHHQVHKISFIAQDLTDTRAFGYIFGSPDTGHRFFGIKTEKSASQVVIAMRDLFQVVFDLKKKEIERAKQQLEMQQKFLATRAAESSNPLLKSTEGKLPLAETYIEGAGATGGSGGGASSSMMVPPNRSISNSTNAPEVDLLNLEEELTSLQVGLDSIHHIQEGGHFRGSTTSISSSNDHIVGGMNRSSVSSSHQGGTGGNPTPVPMHSMHGGMSGGGSGSSDPFGDSFVDPFVDKPVVNFQLGSTNNSRMSTSEHSAASALSSPFTSDPFAQVDPFPFSRPDFLNNSSSDPFDSPSGPFSFSFPAGGGVGGEINRQESVAESRRGRTPSPATHVCDNTRGGGGDIKDGWTASFEDNFVPESSSHPHHPPSSSGGGTGPPSLSKPDLNNLFAELDPLAGSSKFTNRASASSTGSTRGPDSLSSQKSQVLQDSSSGGGGGIPNSFSTNFNPPHHHQGHGPGSSCSDSEFKTPLSSLRGESPPNYSPPPPPRIGEGSSPRPGSHKSNTLKHNNNRVPFINPPAASSSPRTGRKNKNAAALKQMTITNTPPQTSSSPRTLPKLSSGRMMSLDNTSNNNSRYEIPNLSPPPRPPHSSTHPNSSHSSNQTPPNKTTCSTAAVPRPSSSSADKSKQKMLPGVVGIPPEPPPRPGMLQQGSSPSGGNLPIVSPPPLPPKKGASNNTMSTSMFSFNSTKRPATATASNSSMSRSMMGESSTNDLPLPLPQRKEKEPLGALTLKGIQRQRPMTAPMADGYEIPSSKKSSSKLTMEQALDQVASLSLRDLSLKLATPVDQLSTYTIQQLAEKLTEMDLTTTTSGSGRRSAEHHEGHGGQGGAKPNFKFGFGFDDDFSTASAPPTINVQKDSYDRYAVFREISLEDASGFSVINRHQQSDLEDLSISSNTLELDRRQGASRESSSERTLQADIDVEDQDIDDFNDDFKDHDGPLEGQSLQSFMANNNTMDDVTDVNLSEEEDEEGQGHEGTKDFLEDEEGFMKSEWATFESNFDDQFATTALVKAEEGEEEESPEWDSEPGKNPSPLPPPVNQFDFKPFEAKDKPHPPKQDETKVIKTPEKILKSPPPLQGQGQFQRQSSGSSRHSKSSGGGQPTTTTNTRVRGTSDYSGDSDGRKERRRGSGGGGKGDYERWEFEGRYRDNRDRDRGGEPIRSDSRSSYSSTTPRKYRTSGGDRDRDRDRLDSEEEYSTHSIRRSRGGGGGPPYPRRRGSRDFERAEFDDDVPPPVGGPPPIEDRDRDRDYSTSSIRRQRRYPSGSGKHYYHHYRRSRGGGGAGGWSPDDRYSNHESNDESYGEEPYGPARKRERDGGPYAREREYYERERQHRPRPTSSGGGSSSRSRYSPRHYNESSSYYHHGRRGNIKGRYGGSRGGVAGGVDDEDYGMDSREYSEYSGEEEDYPPHPHYHHHHRRMRPKRSYRGDPYDEPPPPPRSHHYYTNSPSWDSESNPEEGKDAPISKGSSGGSRRPNSGKDRDRSPPPPSSNRRRADPDKESSRTTKHQSEVSLSKPEVESPKLLFQDDFGPTEQNNSNSKSRNTSVSSPPPPAPPERKLSHHSDTELTTSQPPKKLSVFEDDFMEPEVVKSSNGDANHNKSPPLSLQEGGQKSPPNILDLEEPLPPYSKTTTTTNGGEGFVLGFDNPSTTTNASSDKGQGFTYSGRRLESIKSEEEKSNDDSHHSSEVVQMKKSDSFNIFKQRTEDPFADDEFFA